MLELPEAARRSLLKLCPQAVPLSEWSVGDVGRVRENAASPFNASTQGTPTVPAWLTLRPYQQEAIANWFANQGRGTLKMATGSGKTVTALAIAAELYRKSVQQKQPLQGLLIVCPYRHLVTQWAEEARKFGLQPILAFETVKDWQGELQSQLLAILSGNQRFVTVITTNATLIRDSFQSQLQFFPKRSLIIGDEAHNLGATRLESSLPLANKLRSLFSASASVSFSLSSWRDTCISFRTADKKASDSWLEIFSGVLLGIG